MRRYTRFALVLAVSLAIPATGLAQVRFSAARLLAGAAPTKVEISPGRLDGRAAVVLRPAPSGTAVDGDSYALIPGSEFLNGEIEVDLAADALPGAPEAVRAFAGLGFRSTPQGYEAFYLRMRNGRSPDQVQRNHSAQYISYPDYGWRRLREATPGRYESYVDLQPARRTHMRIVVCGSAAWLYVDRAEQPTLIVRDLKHGPGTRGAVLLWVGPGTEAKFADLRVRETAACAPPD